MPSTPRHLPEPLVAMIRERIADPERRHYRSPGTYLGVSSDPEEVARLLESGPGEGPHPFRDILQQMREWGQTMQPMHMFRHPDGSVSSSTDSGVYELAPPASDEELAGLAETVGRDLPEDLRQMFRIANGGWGPGYAVTLGRGPGLTSTDVTIQTLEDLRRRGPGYTGEAEWPANLVPLTDNRGPVSYDLDTGQIVEFNDYWYDDDLTIDEAFSVTHASLEDFLTEWVVD